MVYTKTENVLYTNLAMASTFFWIIYVTTRRGHRIFCGGFHMALISGRLLQLMTEPPVIVKVFILNLTISNWHLSSIINQILI